MTWYERHFGAESYDSLCKQKVLDCISKLDSKKEVGFSVFWSCVMAPELRYIKRKRNFKVRVEHIESFYLE